MRIPALAVAISATSSVLACAAALDLDALERVDCLVCDAGVDAAPPAQGDGATFPPTPAVTPTSCLDLLRAGVTTSGVYSISPGGAPVDVYCDMTTEGGGWTLALKVKGDTATFSYDSPLWTNTALLNETAVDLDQTEAKLASFVTLPLTQVLVGIQAPIGIGPFRYVRFPVTATSLKALFNGGYVATSLGRDTWKGIVPDSSLQLRCNREGVNTITTRLRARLGIVGNNEDDCETADSFLGVGLGGDPGLCGRGPPQTTSGNLAAGCQSSDNGTVDYPLFAAVYVRASDFTSEPAEASCLDHASRGRGVSGVYALDTDGVGPNAPFKAYCDMATSGGGWTLALKARGDTTTFAYDSPLWTNPDVLNPDAPDFDETEAKLASFSQMPMNEVLLGLKSPSATGSFRFVRMPINAKSLADLFTSGVYTATGTGRVLWKNLVPGSSLQPGCNREGFNNSATGGSALRLGILGNDTTDCGSSESYLGIGYKPGPRPVGCSITSVSIGNSACGGDNGTVNLPAVAALFVRSTDFTPLSTQESCLAHRTAGRTVSGVYTIRPGAPTDPTFGAYCDMTTDGGGWTLAFVKNSAHLGNYGDFCSNLTNAAALAVPPDLASSSSTATAGWLNLNQFSYSTLRLAAYEKGARTYLSEPVDRGDLRITFGQSGYFLYGDRNGYFWCGGVASFVDSGSGQVNPPPGAPADCKGHSSLGDGWDFSVSLSQNAGLTMSGTRSNLTYGAFGRSSYTGPSPGAAQAIWVR